MRLIVALLLLLITHATFGQDVTGNAERGETLFLSIACYSCHGYNGTGMTPLSKSTSGLLNSETAFLAYMRLRGDKAQLLPSRQMPHYAEEVLSDEELLDIYAYLDSLENQPPAVDDILVLQEILNDARDTKRDDPNPE